MELELEAANKKEKPNEICVWHMNILKSVQITTTKHQQLGKNAMKPIN